MLVDAQKQSLFHTQTLPGREYPSHSNGLARIMVTAKAINQGYHDTKKDAENGRESNMSSSGGSGSGSSGSSSSSRQ